VAKIEVFFGSIHVAAIGRDTEWNNPASTGS